MKALKFAGAILILAVGLTIGVRNCYSQLNSIPSNIEPDRVRPQAKIELPKVQTSPDFVDYFLEPVAYEVKPGQNYPMVHVCIPKKPHFEPHVTSGPVRTYGQTLDMIWPDLAGLGEPGGAACLKRYREGPGGHCENLVRVYMDFMWSQVPSLEQGRLANLDRDIQMHYVKPVDEKSSVPSLELVGATDDKNYSSNRYYISHDATSARGLVFTCAEYVLSPDCEVDFTSTKSSNIRIRIRFVHSLLPQWQQIVNAVQAKVGGMIIQTYSLPNKE